MLKSSWNLLRQLGQDKSKPWMIANDFNEITYSFEKKLWSYEVEKKYGYL